MPPLPRAFYKAATDADRTAEAVWNDCAHPQRLQATGNEVIIPFNVKDKMGETNLIKLGNRLSVLLDEPVEIVRDIDISSFRLVPSAVITKNSLSENTLEDYDIEFNVTRQALKHGRAPVSPRKRIPRPPNAWILYRQHHHAQTTALNPGVPNNNISRLISVKWRSETEDTRQRWHTLAAQVKAQHALDFPDYQYSPRRPGEKLTRRSRVPAEVVDFIGDAQQGAQRLQDTVQGDGHTSWDFNFNLDMDQEFVNMLDGPNGIHLSYSLDHDFSAMVNTQVQRETIETLRRPPLQGNEFDPMFSQENINALLNLDD
ncbi:mating-type HMG-box protein MAT1-2 [Penicillium sp. IBT 16267x]|nr:mating-type HMG-box protein MAT1-2 [Penicillium sp. IBT 16267x]